MRTYEIKDTTVNNILTFLDRVPITGIKEVHAMNEILIALKPSENEKN
ncbi:hypothetical protein NV379_02665 [Paenibacillus sp. N1-5-1-14]|nr:hypothetical protein [Paenibacillus radicibacter]MCR8641549.1 hypothetical protein [Paenibacillus radicibacter]